MDYRWDITPGDAGTDIARTDDEARALTSLVTLAPVIERSPYNDPGSHSVAVLGLVLGEVGRGTVTRARQLVGARYATKGKSRACWRVNRVADDPRPWAAQPRWYSAAHAYRTRAAAIASLVNYHAQDGGLLACHRAALRAQVRAE